MFTSRGLFSSIPCPYKDSCVLPKCLFLHPNPDNAQDTSAAVKDGGANIGSRSNVSDIEQQKRRRGNINGGSTSSKSGIMATPSGQSDRAKGLESIHREVSPPPLRRAESNDGRSPLTKDTLSAIPNTKPPSQASSKPTKVEILNPRLLKHSPASHDMRYKLLKALHDQLARLNTELKKDASSSEEALVLSDQDLITMVLDLEEMAAIDKPSIYSNVVKNRIMAYKRMSVKEWKEERAKELAQLEALKAVNTLNPSCADPPKPIETGLTEEEELKFLPRLYTPITGLAKHGYVSSMPTAEEIDQAKKGIEAAKGWEVCDRCKARFQVFPGRREEDGALASGDTCSYHWGKPYWPEKSANDPKATNREKRYKCCGLAIGDSVGCTQGKTHVFKVSEVKRLAAVLNFEETPKNDDASRTPVCFDCEMGYTVDGLELIRLTVTAWPRGEELLDVLVRPVGEILDLNSRWSGVWPNQMADAVPWDDDTNPDTPNANPDKNGTVTPKLRIVSSPAVARSLLFRHLGPETPLIGHGLENDLNAVRIIHPTIIDTALLFPHKVGLPYRNSLKALMLMYLNRHIQVIDRDKVAGHDSKEDARAAGDLVKWKIGDEWANMKRKGWTLENGEFVPPHEKGQGKLTVDFLETEPVMSHGSQASNGGIGAGTVKSGTKRPVAEISKDEVEEGECEIDGYIP
jgi:RNA exonuclease 1